MWVKAELAFGAGAAVVGVPGAAGHKEHILVPLSLGACPFPQVAVHVVHSKPASALFLAAGAFGCVGVGVALILFVA